MLISLLLKLLPADIKAFLLPVLKIIAKPIAVNIKIEFKSKIDLSHRYMKFAMKQREDKRNNCGQILERDVIFGSFAEAIPWN